ncbi:flagellar hook-associated protein 3, partial [Azotobacter chroococcum]|nr:flagellar hook-associated protein 3 [Azotobacter chroococcum]
LDVLDTVGGNRALNYEQTLSDLVDLDYNAAISEYSLRQVGLQAAQKAFVDIHQLSLFKLL